MAGFGRQCTGFVTTAGGGSKHDAAVLELGWCQLSARWIDFTRFRPSFEARKWFQKELVGSN